MLIYIDTTYVGSVLPFLSSNGSAVRSRPTTASAGAACNLHTYLRNCNLAEQIYTTKQSVSGYRVHLDTPLIISTTTTIK